MARSASTSLRGLISCSPISKVRSEKCDFFGQDWIAECYNQRQLIDIEPYLMHAGKPWRKQSVSKGWTVFPHPPSVRGTKKKKIKKLSIKFF